MATIRIFDHTTKSTVAVSKCDVTEIFACIDNLANVYGKQFGHTKGSIVRMEVNNLDIIALHQWDDFDDTLGPDDGEEIEQYENF